MTDRLRSVNTIRVTVNPSSGILTSTTPVTIKNIPTISPTIAGPGRLDQLTDVYAVNETDKATLVYDAATDKYVVKRIDFTEIDGPIDGGTF